MEKSYSTTVINLDDTLRKIKKLQVYYDGGELIIGDKSKDDWVAINEPLSKVEFKVASWIQRKAGEARDSKNGKEKFLKIIDELPHLFTLVFGLNTSRSCIFNITEKGLVRVTQDINMHPEDKIIPVESIPFTVRELLDKGKNHVIVKNPGQHDFEPDLKNLIKCCSITSTEYYLIHEDWIAVVDTTHGKKCLSEDERIFFVEICEMVRSIILESEKKERFEETVVLEKKCAEDEGIAKALEYLIGMIAHNFRGKAVAVRIFSSKLIKALKTRDGAIYENTLEGEERSREDCERIKLFSDKLLKEVDNLEVLVNEILDHLEVYLRSFKAEKGDFQNFCLSKIVMQAIESVENTKESKENSKKTVSFNYSVEAGDQIKACPKRVEKTLVFMLKKLFSVPRITKVDINLVTCKESVMLVVYQRNFDFEKVKKSYDMETVAHGNFEYALIDIALVAWLKSMESQGWQIVFEGNQCLLFFSK